MRVVYCAPGSRPDAWLHDLRTLLPDATVEEWTGADGDMPAERADYAVVWAPPDAFFAHETRLKALFNLGAGVDALMRSPALPAGLPVVRLEDAGMAPLMAEYVAQAALRHARRLDVMEADARDGRWTPRRPVDRDAFPVGVLGAGALGVPTARTLAALGFPTRLWSRTPRRIEGLECIAGLDALDGFLAATRILVCLLPLTPDTTDLLNRRTMSRLMRGAYVINVARGAHLVDDDLLALIDEGHVAGAALDVFREEPLPASHRFWTEPRITITPHVSAMTQRRATVEQIVGKIRSLERGEPVTGVVDRMRGY